MSDLHERCEAATGPDRDLDREIWVEVSASVDEMSRTGVHEGEYLCAPHYTGSLDAALSLVPLNDRECWAAGWGIDGKAFATIAFARSVKAATPALALCAAALRARAAMEATA